MRLSALSLITLLFLSTSAPSLADETEREITLQRQVAADLTGMDARHVVADEIAILRAWIDEAAKKLSNGEADRAHEALDRCTAQAELVRQKLETAKVVARAVEKEKAAQDAREKLKHDKKALEDALARKKTLMEAAPK
jgi:hypothetical protein